MAAVGNLCLGIDIGTTSVKLTLIDQNGCVIEKPVSTPSNAVVPSVSAPRLGSEQNISLIFQAIEDCLKRVGSPVLSRVTRIGVTGQMHGCVLWKSHSVCIASHNIQVVSGGVSPLFNWQDGRCSSSFLGDLPEPDSHLRVATGNGCATLFWWSRNQPDYLDQFDHAGNVMDLFVTALCGLDVPVMSVQIAASWGYFNCQSQTWNEQILSAAGFPIQFLPKVKAPGSLAGTLQTNWLGLTAGTKVSVAMGDVPCYVYSVLENPSDAVLNIGTSAQLVRSMPEGFVPQMNSSPTEYFPYFDSKYITVAAALNGGNALSTFVDTLLQWCSLLGSNKVMDKDQVFTKLISLAAKAETDLVVDPLLLGERHKQNQFGSMSNIRPDNTELGGFFRAVCRGIVKNIETMMPREELINAGMKRIVGCGSALCRNLILKEELEHCFKMPVFYRDDSDACLGAALYVSSADWA